MADTRVQGQIEEWVRLNWLPAQFGQPFQKGKRALDSGGYFEFDGVSEDTSIAVCISTAAGITSGGKHPTAKVQKLRSDMYFLLLARVERRILCVTAKDMKDILDGERARGRVARPIEVVYAELPPELEARLEAARRVASLESKPLPLVEST